MQPPCRRAGAQAAHASGGFLATAQHAFRQIRTLLMQDVRQIPAIVNHDVRLAGKRLHQMVMVLLVRRPMDSKHLHAQIRQARGHVILRGKRVTARGVHLRASLFQQKRQPGGFGLHMNGQRHAHARERLFPRHPLFQGGEQRHMGARPFDFRFARRRERRIGYRAHFASLLITATACALMPNPSPSKPSRSVVVALMFTRETSTPSTRATFARISSM